ncbi:MAG: elongation factor 4 [Planctomycetes bacterium]|nr:elongation factor 4 [Planctomycetota bacterium]MDP6423592.1 translation elongation factor 4 [Planctomycetota bacterium]
MSGPLTQRIRNFSIIAHIDHGKSTLADRLMELTGTVTAREMQAQLLDDMELERERGITIKAKAVSMHYTAKDGNRYLLNLIDTPGHVDFSYEVEKSLEACEGALLLVDASQGVEAQTVANAHLAEVAGLAMIPVLNKVDLPTAQPDEAAMEIENAICLPAEDCLHCSAKTGVGVDDVLEAIVERVPPPEGQSEAPLQALIFDSFFDDYRGVVIYCRIVNGTLEKRQRIWMPGTKTAYEVLEVGHMKPAMQPRDKLSAGEVGYLISNIKRLDDVVVGDSILIEKGERAEPLPGFKRPKPMVFCGLFPTNAGDFDDLRKALDKLKLNDSSFSYEPESSDALGFGYRCGFLGLLHMAIVQERLEREDNMDLVQTAPTVVYQIQLDDGSEREVHSPSELPDGSQIRAMLEPIVKLSIMIPAESIGSVMRLATDRRGRYVTTEVIGHNRQMLTFEIPLAEIIYDFHDKLKSVTRGYGTMDYELIEYRQGNLVPLRVMVNGEDVDALCTIVHRDDAERRGREVIQALRKEIPRQMFQIPIQAAIYGKIVARENIRALSKNVTAKCYGGDISRKRKLWEKQKKGKKRMKMVGNVEIPQKAFLAVLKSDD